MIKLYLVCVLMLFAVALAACDSREAPNQQASETRFARTQNAELIKQGETVFRANCSRCHGERAQGDANWRRPGPDGKYPPPPLDGTGHAWHHPSEVLKEVIQEGTAPQGNMPAWRGKLTEDDINAVIAWFQSLWPEEVYQVWTDMDHRYREE